MLFRVLISCRVCQGWHADVHVLPPPGRGHALRVPHVRRHCQPLRAAGRERRHRAPFRGRPGLQVTPFCAPLPIPHATRLPVCCSTPVASRCRFPTAAHLSTYKLSPKLQVGMLLLAQGTAHAQVCCASLLVPLCVVVPSYSKFSIFVPTTDAIQPGYLGNFLRSPEVQSRLPQMQEELRRVSSLARGGRFPAATILPCSPLLLFSSVPGGHCTPLFLAATILPCSWRLLLSCVAYRRHTSVCPLREGCVATQRAPDA